MQLVIYSPIKHSPHLGPRDIFGRVSRPAALCFSSSRRFIAIKDVCLGNGRMPIFDKHLLHGILNFFDVWGMIARCRLLQVLYDLAGQPIRPFAVSSTNSYRCPVNSIAYAFHFERYD
jgi:hypothetical protein